jgi:hypothetical protein
MQLTVARPAPARSPRSPHLAFTRPTTRLTITARAGLEHHHGERRPLAAQPAPRAPTASAPRWLLRAPGERAAGESFSRVHWVAVAEASRARRVNRRRRRQRAARRCGRRLGVRAGTSSGSEGADSSGLAEVLDDKSRLSVLQI